MGIRWVVVAVVLAVGAAACGSSSPDEIVAAATPTAAAEPMLFPSCDDVPNLSAPDDWYRPEPIYVFNEMPVDEVRAWASAEPGFVDAWIDRERSGWVTVAFTGEAEALQAELEAAFPDEGVVAVEVDPTLDLEALEQRVVALAPEFGPSATLSKGVVEVWVGVLAEERIALLEPLVGEPICLRGVAPETVVPEGPQQTSGPGWRLLGDELVGPHGSIGVATTAQQYEALWATVGLSVDRPAVDFESEVVIWFGAIYGSGCELRFDGLVVDHEEPLVHGEIVLPGMQGCNHDANPHSFVVAVERGLLPDGPFAIQLPDADPPDRGHGLHARVLVDADLTEPGATVDDDAVTEDGTLFEPNPYAEIGDFLEPGYADEYELDLSCGIGQLGEFNDTGWTTTETEIPQEWAGAETIVVELLLTTPPAKLTATANGRSVTYAPTHDPIEPCD